MRPPRSTVRRSSDVTGWSWRASTPGRRSPSETASSPSRPTRRACRPSPRPTTRRSRSGRSRSGAGTRRRTRRGGAWTDSDSRTSRRQRPRGPLRGHPWRPADAGGRVAAPEPPPAAPRPHRLPAHARGRQCGDSRRPPRHRADPRPVDGRAAQPLPARRRDGRGRDALSTRPLDLVAVRVVSPLLRRGRIAIRLRFPYGTGDATAADWTRPEAHETKLVRVAAREAAFERRLDGDRYHVAARVVARRPAPRAGATRLRARARRRTRAASKLVLAFSPDAARGVPPGLRGGTPGHAASTGSASGRPAERSTSPAAATRGGASSSAASCSRSTSPPSSAPAAIPPQETGLTFNSWHGKFHLEMHWWHAAHFALWGRLPLLERSLGYYADDPARERGPRRAGRATPARAGRR